MCLFFLFLFPKVARLNISIILNPQSNTHMYNLYLKHRIITINPFMFRLIIIVFSCGMDFIALLI